MVVFEIFSHAKLHRYKCHIFSKATAIHAAITILTYLFPFIIIYLHGDVWIRERYHKIQPNITFKKELILILHTTGGTQSYLTFSTFDNFNKLQQNYLRTPLIKSMENTDELQLTIEVPMYASENVVDVEMLLFFYYAVPRLADFHMESMAYIHHSSVVPGAKLLVSGSLETIQRRPFHHTGIDSEFNEPIIDANNAFASEYDLPTILKKYNKRKIITTLKESYYTWTVGIGAKTPFTISVDINYLEQNLYEFAVPTYLGLGTVLTISVAIHCTKLPLKSVHLQQQSCKYNPRKMLQRDRTKAFLK